MEAALYFFELKKNIHILSNCAHCKDLQIRRKRIDNVNNGPISKKLERIKTHF